MNKVSWFIRILLVVPFLYWAWSILDGSLGAEPAKELNHQTGYISLLYFLINLWIGFLLWLNHYIKSKANPNVIRLLIQQRRFLGVTNFFILLAHVFLYLVLEGFELKGFYQILDKTYLQFGLGAFSLIAILAATSNNFSVRKLGGKKWKQLHRITYLAFFLVLGHIFLIEKADLIQFAVLTLPLAILQLIRLTATLIPRKPRL